MSRREIAAVLFASLMAGCASGPAEPIRTEEEALQAEAEPEAPQYVVLSRLTPLFLQPSSDSVSIVYRTDEQQQQRLAKMAAEQEKIQERLARRAERDAEREERRAKRVKKRMRRLRGERRDAYRERQEERAARRSREAAEATLEREVDWVRDHPGEAAHEHLFAAELVETSGDWVGIRPIQDSTPRCYAGAAHRLSRLDVVMWVKRAALYDVITTRTRVPVAHGTEVILAEGIAMRDGRAFVDGFELGLKVPDDAVGMTYESVRGFEAPFTETTFSPLAYTNKWLRLEKDAPLPFNPWHPLHVTATLYVGDRFYATTQTPCAEYTVRTVEEALEPVGERGAMRLGSGLDSDVSAPLFKAGATVYDPDGEPMGTVRTDLPVVDEWEGPADMRCWHYEVWNGTEGRRRLPLCVKTDDFQALNLTDGL